MAIVLSNIYDKTDKGRKEISTRKHRLEPKSRVILVMVDGKHSGQALLKDLSVFGCTEERIIHLIEDEFINGVAPTEIVVPAAQKIISSAEDIAKHLLEVKEMQYEALYHFYNHTIKSTLGLRGFFLQLKVEQCSSVEDFRALRTPYVSAVHKSQGDEMAESLGARLDQLLDSYEQSSRRANSAE